MKYEYKERNSKKVEDVPKYANEEAAHGWELLTVLACQDRYVSIYRKPTT